MTTASDTLALVAQIDSALAHPRVRRVWIPEPAIAEDKDAEFGVIELDDGATGLFYAWLGESQAGIANRYDPATLAGTPAMTLAQCLAGDDDVARSIGLAAINALTQSLFTRAGFEPADAADSMAGFAFAAGDHLGMVGNFPTLVRQARARGVPVTVIERKHHMLQESAGCIVTLDPSRLAGCNKIICTAATLINGSVDDMLAYCRDAEIVAMLGPSAGFPPEPVFARGVAIVGGSRIADAEAVIMRQRAGLGLRGCARRYVLERDTWPGTHTLIARVAD